MKKIMHTFFWFSVLIMASALPLCATNYTFNAPSGDWSVAANWSPVGIPGAGDNVTLNAGTVTLTFDVSVNDLTQNGGIIQGLGAINVAGNLVWHKGDFDNQGTITVSGNLMSVNPSPGAPLSNLNRRYGALILNGGGTLENPKMAFLNGADFEVGAGTTLTIDATALANFTSISVNSAGSTLNFQGNIIKNGPKGFSLSNSGFSLSNQITINQGVFGIGGNSSHIITLNGCTINMTSGTTFRMNPGTLNLTNTTFLGNGTFDASVGTININSGNTFPTTTVFNLTINSNGIINTNQTITIRTIFVNSGTLSVCSNQNLTITFNLTNASRIKGFGSITIAPGAVFDNTGTVAAGCSTGTLTFIGNYSNHIMDFEVEESSGIPSADLLNVTGNISLGGTLNIQYLGGNVPPGTYDIATCTGTCTGTFATINYPANCNGNCSVIYTANKAQLVLAAVLPLELLHFSALPLKNQIQLHWQTSSEQNFSHFELERSPNGTQWTVLGSINGESVEKNVQDYDFLDQKPLPFAYYRLRMKDFDNNEQISRIISVKNDIPKDVLVATPNPASDQLMFHLQVGEPGTINYFLYNAAGLIIRQGVQEVELGENKIFIPSSRLDSGIYLLEVQTQNGILTTRVAKNK